MTFDEQKVIVGDFIGWELQAAVCKDMSLYYMWKHDLLKVLCTETFESTPGKIDEICNSYIKTFQGGDMIFIEEERQEFKRKAKMLKPVPMPSYMVNIMKEFPIGDNDIKS